MLADERQNHRRQIGFEVETRENLFVERLRGRDERVHCDFDPSALRPLFRMVESWEFGRLCAVEACVFDSVDQSQAFEPTQMLTRN
jgi:hypothetical protein